MLSTVYMSLALSVLLFAMLERVLHALSSLLVRALLGHAGGSPLTGYASLQLLGAFTTYLTSVTSSLATATTSLAVSLATYALLALIVTFAFACMYVMHEYYPDLLVGGVEYWNNFFGPFLHHTLIVPLQLVDLLIAALLPLYNCGMWILSQTFRNIVLAQSIRDAELYQNIGSAVFGLAKESALSLAHWLPKVAYDCEDPASALCYAAGPRVLDLLTPMGEVRKGVGAAVAVSSNLCRGFSTPIEIAAYPFLDISFAKFIHLSVNSVLFTIFHVPGITAQRCTANNKDLALCLPDFNPSLNMLLASLRSLGRGLDNWLDVSYALIQTGLGIADSTTLGCESAALALTPANASTAAFGTNRTVTVGLTNTLYAVTDGYSAQYFHHHDASQTVLVPNIWPIPVDVSLGIAAVTFANDERDALGNPSTTMLGCRCVDNDGKPPIIQIQCALALYELAAYGDTVQLEERLTFNVYFQQRSTANYLSCQQVQISVQSARWPATRFSGAVQSDFDVQATCQAKGECSAVDATIWVQPLCAASATSVSSACVEGFREASCFPYCMAARRAGSQADGLVLYSAQSWRDQVHLFDRDCGIANHPLTPSEASTGTAHYELDGSFDDDPRNTVTTVRLNDLFGGGIRTRNWDPELGCIQTPLAYSNVGINLMPSYRNNRWPSLLMPGQPFAYAGDTTLTAVRDHDGQYYVAVSRLYGDNVNHFTMINVQKRFPANPPADTIASLTRKPPRQDALSIPFAFDAMAGIRHPATATKTSVFFAINPSLDMMRGFANGCRTNGRDWRLQLVVLSNYAPLQIHKINPYVFCPVGETGENDCKQESLIAPLILPDAFTDIDWGDHLFDEKRCDAEFAVEITGMDYIDEENIGVTVLYATFRSYDPNTGVIVDRTGVRHRTFFVRAVGEMAYSDTPWVPVAPVSTNVGSGQGSLCSAMRRTPNLGSLATEMAVSGVNLARPVINLIVFFPGLVDMWITGKACGLDTKGHSLLAECGADIVSLDDFFDSINRANQHFWRAFGMVAQQARNLGLQEVANTVDGMVYVGEATLMPATPYVQVLRAMKLPIDDISSRVVGGLLALSPWGTISQVVVRSPLRIAHFSYSLVTSTIFDMIRLAATSSADTVARAIGKLFVNKLYDARDAFFSSVVLSTMQSCTGVSVMLGFNNPWSIFIRKECEAGPWMLKGLTDIFLTSTVTVGFVHCICVDSAQQGASFSNYAMENCYAAAPDFMKAPLFSIIEQGDADTACSRIVNFTRNEIEQSMEPFFTSQYEGAEQLANAMDYLLRLIDPTAGRCMDFSNPYATVLIPEPQDYWTACGRTSTCTAKCSAEVAAFERERERFASAALQRTVYNSISQESPIFAQHTADSYTPFNIACLVQLHDCTFVCGGGADDLPSHSAKAGIPVTNRDTCIAAAGVAANGTIVVKKFCIPKKVGSTAYAQDSETWYVWGSEAWSGTTLELRFGETTLGNTLIAYRDNRGRHTDSGLVEQHVTVHPRYIQRDTALYGLRYGSATDRNARLTLFAGSRNVIPHSATVEAILGMFVLPKDHTQRAAWIFLDTILRPRDGSGGTYKQILCAPVDFVRHVDTLGDSAVQLFRDCETVMRPFFTAMETEGNTPVTYATVDSETGVIAPERKHVALMPTKHGGPLRTATFEFVGNELLDSVTLRSLPASSSFVTQSKYPTAQGWLDATNAIFAGRDVIPSSTVLTQEAIAVKARKRFAQNMLDTQTLPPPGQSKTVTVFTTNDPKAPTHWLHQLRMTIKTYPPDDGTLTQDQLSARDDRYVQLVTAEMRSSQQVAINVELMHSCDRRSCLGCPNLRLQSMCGAMHNCMVVRCIGTVVNQARPLCNMGLSMQSAFETMLSLLRGAWLIGSETYIDLLQLSTRQRATDGDTITIAWADDAFYGTMCSSKDALAQSVAIVTSVIGERIRFAYRLVTLQFVFTDAGVRQLDDHFTAQFTLIQTGFSSLLYHVTLLPQYVAIGLQKAFVCDVNSLLGVVGVTGFDVRLGRADLQQASSVAAGQCLTGFFEEEAEDPLHDGTAASVGAGASDLLSSVGSAFAQRAGQAAVRGLTRRFMGPGLHLMDALLTYAMGIVSGMQDLVQQLDSHNCRLPDYYIHQTTTCACDDNPVTIPAEMETVERSMHWCTGTLRMIDAFGNPRYVYNPLSYGDLRSIMGGNGGRNMDAYLECIARLAQDGSASTSQVDCTTLEPRYEPIHEQGVTTIAVFNRCKANYNQKQFDEGAYLLYDEVKRSQFLNTNLQLPSVYNLPSSSVGQCLLDAEARGASNQGCLQDFLFGTQTAVQYFRYENITDGARLGDSRFVDACVVFSGPANAGIPEFQQCSNEYASAGCRIPHMLWSSGSSNRVPVANMHSVRSDSEAGRASHAEALYVQAQNDALAALESLEGFTDESLDVFLFSGEGDSLHQIFDCAVQGPYARVDFWPRGAEGELDVPYWARDSGGAGLSRDMDLPCTGAKLLGDTRPPFTCGSHTRRAIIKDFVRNYINNGERKNRLVEELVRERVAALREAWTGDTSIFHCLCSDGATRSLACCTSVDEATKCSGTGFCRDCPCDDGTFQLECCETVQARESCEAEVCTNNYLPESVQEEFIEISGDEVTAKITSQIPPFLASIFTDNAATAFRRYNGDEPNLWDWGARGTAAAAADEAMFISHTLPIMNYSAGEVGSPFRFNRSVWWTCTGLLSQVLFTIPLSVHTYDDEHQQWTLSTVAPLRTVNLAFDYTLPRDFDNGDPEDASGLSMLERYVQRLLAASFRDASTFWHYAVRHVPSESLACARDVPYPRRNGTSKVFFTNANSALPPEILPANAAGAGVGFEKFGYAAFPIGDTPTGCFCGWEHALESARCTIPAKICTDIARTPDCTYAHGTPEAWDVVERVLAFWPSKQGWECPELELSDSWGIVSFSKADEWILSPTDSGSDVSMDIASLLYEGRAGLRIGSLSALRTQARDTGVWPSARAQSLFSADYTADVAIRRCGDSIRAAIDAPSLVQEIVDDLFPVAQGIRESMPMSTCLRYVIEYSKLRVYRAISENIRPLDQDAARERQESTVERWKIKCETQLQLVGMCRAFNVFESFPDERQINSDADGDACPYIINEDYYSSPKRFYVTPGCLVYTTAQNFVVGDETLPGVFHDPCRKFDCTAETKASRPTITLADLDQTTLIQFDARATAENDALGTWPIRFNVGNGPEASKRQAQLARDLETFEKTGRDGIPRRLNPSFIRQVVEKGGGGSDQLRGNIGNVPSGGTGTMTWGTAEGFAGGGDDAAEYCDGIADWWPEDWTKPVGYHVTTPCASGETAYRTFDSLFAVEKGSGLFEVARMRYMHSALRNRSAYNNEFGAAGFCRRGNYGMPLLTTNVIRVCTRDVLNAEYDATVPVQPRYTGSGGTAEYDTVEHCSDSPYDVPWGFEDESIARGGMFGVGNAPMYRGETWSESGIWPPTDRDAELRNTRPGPRGVAAEGWGGDGCGDGQILTCETDADCVPVPGSLATLECVRGTCVLPRTSTQTCYSHEDCEAENKVCSGDGRCTFGTWQVENDLPYEHGGKNTLEFEMYTAKGTCTSGNSSNYPTEEYDNWGGSPWEAVGDILEMYGMCSYRNWYEYLAFVDPDQDPSRKDFEKKNSGLCRDLDESLRSALRCQADTFDANRAKWWDTEIANNEDLKSLWDSKRFRVEGHPCDRDYQHITGMRGCAPKLPQDRSQLLALFENDGQRNEIDARRGRYVQTYSRLFDATDDDREYIFANMGGRAPFPALNAIDPAAWPDDEYRRHGFLSLEGAWNLDTFRACADVEQCSVDTFTYNGKSVPYLQRTGVAMVDGTLERRLWKGSDGEYCGVFGFKVDDSLCGNANGFSCCQLDRAILPMFEVLCDPLKAHADHVEYVKGNCTSTVTVQWLRIEAVCDRFRSTDSDGNIFYNVESAQGDRDAKLASIARELNSLIDYVALEGPITGTDQYLEVIDCSTSIYDAMQVVTQCDGRDTNPFCAAYHVAEDVSEKKLGLYYLLSYSAQELPFSFAHQCMWLHSKKFETELVKGDAIVCPEWNSEDGDDLTNIDYSSNPLRELRHIRGGLSTAQRDEALEQYYLDLLNEVQVLFNNEGSAGGLDQDFRFRCAKRYTFHDDPNCYMDFLGWWFRDLAEPSFFRHRPEDDKHPGVREECYSVDEDSRAPPSGGLQPPVDTIRRHILGDVVSGDGSTVTFESSRVASDFKLHNFAETCTGKNCDFGRLGELLLGEYDPAPFSSTQIIPEYEERIREWDRIDSRNEYDYTHGDERDGGFVRIYDKPQPPITFRDVYDKLDTCDESTVEYGMLPDTGISMEPRFLTRELVDRALVDARTVLSEAGADPFANYHGTVVRPQSTTADGFEHVEFSGFSADARAVMDGVVGRRHDSFVEQLADENSFLCYFPTADYAYYLAPQGRTVFGYDSRAPSTGINAILDKAASGFLMERCWMEDTASGFEQFVTGVVDAVGQALNPAGGSPDRRYQREVCEPYKATTGIRELDRVFRRLSTDPRGVTELFTWVQGGTVEPRDQQRFEEAMAKLAGLMTDHLYTGFDSCSVDHFDKCLFDVPITTQGHFHPHQQQWRSYFKATRFEGNFDCKFNVEERSKGLAEEIARASDSRVLKTAVTKKQASLWPPTAGRVIKSLSEMVNNNKDADRITYTLWLSTVRWIMDPRNTFAGTDRPLGAAYATPRKLQFFEDARDWAVDDFQFNLQQRREFEADLKIFDQTCNDDSPVLEYGECSSDDLLRLYRHSRENMDHFVRKDGPVVVPELSVLVWPGVGFLQHVSETLPAWSLHHRPRRQKFAEWIFDDDGGTGQCAYGNRRNSVCVTENGRTVPLNPWTGGNWNPWVMCDTNQYACPSGGEDCGEETITVDCNVQTCPETNPETVATTSNPYQDTYYHFMPDGKNTDETNLEVCYSKYNRRRSVSKRNLGTGEGFGNNLCAKKPDVGTTCTWKQGKLVHGIPSARAHNLYDDGHSPLYVDETLATVGKGLFYRGGNPVYWVQKGPLLADDATTRNVHTFLKQNRRDIGGHHVVFKMGLDALSGGQDPFLYVDRTPLVAIPYDEAEAEQVEGPARYLFDQSGASQPTHGVLGWRTNLRAAMLNEERLYRALYPEADDLGEGKGGHWSCPLKRYAFWTGSHDGFAPLVPSPPRAGRLFGDAQADMTYGTRSHPTQRFRALSGLANAFTSNGFCFCTTPAGCRVANSDRTDVCGLRSTVSSLHDQQYRVVSLRRVDSSPTCGRQLDWPFEAGTARDGMQWASRHSTSDGVGTQCNVMDRLPPFMYAYKPVGSVRDFSQGRTTLDEGGSCHMGHAPSLNAVPVGVDTLQCRTINTTRAHVNLKCTTGTTSEEELDVQLPREKSMAPDWMVKHMRTRRQKCSQCSAPPEYVVEKSDDPMPAGPEASVGVPFRWSAARMLAADVKEAVCGGGRHNATEECTRLLGPGFLSKQAFLDALFADGDSEAFASLFAAGTVQGGPSVRQHLEQASTAAGLDENDLWDGPDAGWVGCNKYNNTCYGGIPKHLWQSTQRAQVCTEKFAEVVDQGLINSTSFGINLCNLNGELNDLCLRLKSAQTLIFRANCIYAGACEAQEFVYTPTMYSLSNEEFTRSTVQRFYQRYAGGLEAGVCRTKEFEQNQALRERNERLTEACASRQLEGLHDLIRIARRAVHVIAEGTFIAMNLGFNLIRLALPVGGSLDTVFSEIAYWFGELLNLIYDTIVEMANLVFRMIFDESDFGQQVKQIASAVCTFLNWIIELWDKISCGFMREVAAPLVGFAVDLVNVVNGLTAGSVPGIQGALENLKRTKTNLETAQCNSSPFDCQLVYGTDTGAPVTGTLPVATRCWATYIPNVDDSDALSCSASDTCRVSTLASGTTLLDYGGLADSDGREVVCDACPFDENEDVLDYACDDFTKQCTCNRVRHDKTRCTTNAQCQIQGDDPSFCALVGDFTTGTSYGSMRCQTCPTVPVCHIVDGASPVGTCTCMQQMDAEIMSCRATEVGSEVMVDNTRLCAVKLDVGARSSQERYYAWEELATAPCALVGSSTSRCAQVPGKGNYVVGMEVNSGNLRSARDVALGAIDFVEGLGSAANTFAARVGGGGRRRLLMHGNGTISDNGMDEGARMATRVRILQQMVATFEQWEHVAEPCRSLAVMLKGGVATLGPVDVQRAESCLFWRNTARAAAGALNMTYLNDENDHVFMSVEDFVHVAAKRGVLRSLLRMDLVHFVVQRLPLYRKLQELYRNVLLSAVGMHVDRLLRIYNYTSILAKVAENGTMGLTIAERDVLAFVEGHNNVTQLLLPFMDASVGRGVADPVVATGGSDVEKTTGGMYKPDPVVVLGKSNAGQGAAAGGGADAGENTARQKAAAGSKRQGRNLLQVDDPVTTFSTLTSTVSGYSDIPLSDTLAATWLAGPSWPPNVDVWNGDNSCAIGRGLVDVGIDSVLVLDKFYRVNYLEQRLAAPNWDIRANLPAMSTGGNTSAPGNASFGVERERLARRAANADTGDVVVWYFEFFTKNVLEGAFGITPEGVAGFFSMDRSPATGESSYTFAGVVREMLQCDYEATQLCNKTRRNLAISFVVAYVMYLCVDVVLFQLNARGLSTFVYLSIPLATIYIAYGVSPACVPMVPTCLFQDAVSVVQQVLPAKIVWPNALQYFDGCLGPTWIELEEARRKGEDPPVKLPDPRYPNISIGSGLCLRSCREDPFHFSSWEDSLAWVACGWDRDVCGLLEMPLFPRFQEAALNYSAVLAVAHANGDTDTVNAYSYCFWSTIGLVVPYVFVGIALFFFIEAGVRFVMGILAPTVNVAMQAVAYTNLVDDSHENA